MAIYSGPGKVLMLTTLDDPFEAVSDLKSRYSWVQGLLTDYYKLSGNQVTAVLTRVTQPEKQVYRYKRQHRTQDKNETEQLYYVEFTVQDGSRGRQNQQLTWVLYSICTKALSDATHREGVKLSLNKDVGTVLSDKNPATPEWLAGPDLTAESNRVEKDRKDIAKMKHFFPFSNSNQGGRQSTTDNRHQGYGGNKNNQNQSKIRSNASYKKEKSNKPYN